MTGRDKSLEEHLRESWLTFRQKLPADLGTFLDPRQAFEKIIVKNGKAILQELAESGEALVLLGKLARNRNLTEAESAALKNQLADMAKAVPALGIFALPGGMLLLPILAKCLPWDLVPSAFKNNADNGEEKKPEQ